MLHRQEHRHWSAPVYPDFPKEEYDNRIRQAKVNMAKENVDILVLWDETNIRYFSGFHNLHWSSKTLQCAVLLIPLEGESVIIVPDFFSPVVEGFTFISDIRLQSDPHVTANLRALPALVADAVKGLGCGLGRIGLESGEKGGMCIPRPINDIDFLRVSLEGATFVEAANLIWRCRVIKSPAEIAALKHATQAVVDSYGELMDKFHLGMGEKEVALFLRKEILDRTEDCPSPFIISTGRGVPMADVPAYDEKVELNPGDRIILEPLPTHKGYFGSCCRVLNVGPISDEVLRRAELMDELQDQAIAVVKPGAKTGDILEAILEGNRKDGVMDYFIDMAGHGVGLNFQEPPAIARNEEYELEEGMVLAIETWEVSMTEAGVAVAAVEDYVTVTKDGCEPFPSFPRDLRCLPID